MTTTQDTWTARALLHHANGHLGCGAPIDGMLPQVTSNLALAERLLAGNASAVDRRDAYQGLCPAVRLDFRLTPPAD